MTTDLIERKTITTIVENVNVARTEIASALELLQCAKTRLKATLGHGAYLWNGRRDPNDYDLTRTTKDVDAFQVQQAWEYLIRQTGLTHFMTDKRARELQEQLAKGALPELTVENVMSTIQGLAGQAGTLLDESIAEVFQWLRPSPYASKPLKTNKKYHVPYKVILPWMCEAQYTRGARLRYGIEAKVRSLGNVLSLLDGHGVQAYPDDLCTQLNVALGLVGFGVWVETPYVKAKGFRNNNMHLVFTKPNLIDELNRRAGNGTLPGQE